MVFCCVPQCGIDSWRCDPSITFHEFPSKPDVAAKWIQQINAAVKKNQSDPMWFPKGNPMICSKHFLSTDFKDDSDSLKQRVVPSVFGHKYIGLNSDITEKKTDITANKSGPLIVKIKTEDGGSEDIFISDIDTQSKILETIINEPENIFTTDTQPVQNITFTPSHKTYSKKSNMGVKRNINSPIKSKQTSLDKRSILKNSVVKKPIINNKTSQKRDNNDNLIEIGPNTFLKINPEIIKINKKQTPAGNTVLQFLMDQKLASTIGPDVLPKIVQGAISNIGDMTATIKSKNSPISIKNKTDSTRDTNTDNPNSDAVVQHVLGHLVDTHVYKESCSNLDNANEILTDISGKCTKLTDKITNSSNVSTDISLNSSSECSDANKTISGDKTDPSCMEKAPVLLTTNMSLAHCFMEKTKYHSNLRQKARQVATLKQKISSLNKKIEELEDKCVVQERQLSFSFLKRLRTIRKNASKGDPPATYILEQIRAYTGQKQMRWSNSTLNQCAIWCRKAPYAYEYFKKADFFKLPCLGTVKRHMKKHPEMSFSSKSTANINGGEEGSDSSSDFDFDEEESADEKDKKDNQETSLCETVLTEDIEHSPEQTSENNTIGNHSVEQSCEVMEVEIQHSVTSETHTSVHHIKTDNGTFPVTVDGTNLELRELLLPSGEVVQCYSSNGTQGGGQYYIIPSAGDQVSNLDQEYSIVQSAESVPVILQNIDHSQLHQEQLIFITNSSDQVECTETEVSTAP